MSVVALRSPQRLLTRAANVIIGSGKRHAEPPFHFSTFSVIPTARNALRGLLLTVIALIAALHPPVHAAPAGSSEYSYFWEIAAGVLIVGILLFLVNKLARRNAGRAQQARNKQRSDSISLRRNAETAAGTAVPNREAAKARTPASESSSEKDAVPAITVIQTQWKNIQDDGFASKPKAGDIEADLNESLAPIGYNPFFMLGESAIEVKEIGNTLTEAELVRSLGLHQQAIDLLERLIGESSNPKPKIWLMLFDLYVKTQQQEKYNNLAQAFRTYFNAAAPPWDVQSPDAFKQLEDYASPINKIVALWGTPGCDAYLEGLLYDNRNATRQGFSLSAYNDIIFLVDIIELLEAASENEKHQRAQASNQGSS
jgi:hypothetical protein